MNLSFSELTNLCLPLNCHGGRDPFRPPPDDCSLWASGVGGIAAMGPHFISFLGGRLRLNVDFISTLSF